MRHGKQSTTGNALDNDVFEWEVETEEYTIVLLCGAGKTIGACIPVLDSLIGRSKSAEVCKSM